jgi:threonine dehydratase
MTLDQRLTLADVERARARIAPYLRPTPLRRAFCLPDARLWLKLECWQPTGSFKVRGALNRLAALSDAERARGVVAASAGNHALGVAFAAEALGGRLRATLFVPLQAPAAKIDKLRRFAVEIVQHGQTYDDAYAAAREHAQRTGAVYVHAFDDPDTAAGQGTVGLEILDDLPDVGSLLVPVGGGGLITGVAVALKARRPQTRIVAVQPEASPALRESLRLGRPLLEYPAAPTLCDGLSGGIGELVFAHRDLIDATVEVSEAETTEAIRDLLESDQVLAEASGAVGLAALRGGRLGRLPEPIVAVVTGANLDVRVLARLLAPLA